MAWIDDKHFMFRMDLNAPAVHVIDPETGEGYCSESQRQYKGSVWHQFRFVEKRPSFLRECQLCATAKAKKLREKEESMSNGKKILDGHAA